jgi:hypothetical protein
MGVVVFNDVDRCVVGLAAMRILVGRASADLLCDSVGGQRHVVGIIFWNALARLGVCRDLRVVGFDRGNQLFVLAKGRCRSWIVGPLFGMGYLRIAAQFLNLAAELIRKDLRPNANSVVNRG